MCLSWLGPSRETGKDEELEGAPLSSMDTTLQSKDFSVRIVHAGGQEELYENVVPASQMMKKYPGMCVARPEVFRNAHASLLRPEEILLPGHKYYMIPFTTAEKLKRRQQRMIHVNGPSVGMGETSDARITCDLSQENKDDSVCSAKAFYVPKGRSSRSKARRAGKGKKPFVAPLPKTRICQSIGWEPSLTSVQEVSP